jgi:hypothetical protein
MIAKILIFEVLIVGATSRQQQKIEPVLSCAS